MDDAYNAKLLADSAKNAPSIISTMIEKARLSGNHWKRKSENFRMSDSDYDNTIIIIQSITIIMLNFAIIMHICMPQHIYIYAEHLADSSKKAQCKK